MQPPRDSHVNCGTAPAAAPGSWRRRDIPPAPPAHAARRRLAVGLRHPGAACATALPDAVKADIARRLPATLGDRNGWADDVYVALSSQGLDTSAEHICAVLAVTEQESTYQANPVVPNLGKISRAEIDRRASAHHIPGFMVDAALRIDSPDGRSYATRIASARTEQELSRIFEDFTGSVPLGARLFDRLNPVHTAGPMQVSIAFAEQHAERYPYPPGDSIRHEVFGRRGGLWFGTRHLLGYPASYDALLYRFADFNAGWYASRNAAFQAALSKASGIALTLDGDLLTPGAGLDAPGGTERAARALGSQLAMSDRQLRRALKPATLPISKTPRCIARSSRWPSAVPASRCRARCCPASRWKAPRSPAPSPPPGSRSGERALEALHGQVSHWLAALRALPALRTAISFPLRRLVNTSPTTGPCSTLPSLPR